MVMKFTSQCTGDSGIVATQAVSALCIIYNLVFDWMCPCHTCILNKSQYNIFELTNVIMFVTLEWRWWPLVSKLFLECSPNRVLLPILSLSPVVSNLFASYILIELHASGLSHERGLTKSPNKSGGKGGFLKQVFNLLAPKK